MTNIPLNNSEIQFKIKKIHEIIIKWGMCHLRDFPWRKTKNPYKILIAEIMLHRTQANQVKEIYEDFIIEYPDFCSICRTDPDIISFELEKLGLHWRAKLLYKLSCKICEEFDGNIPTKKNDLIQLPGIGHYIASAFLCFAYNQPYPLLDTNTIRILGRVFGLKITDSSRRSKQYENLMYSFLSSGNCKKFSLSLIDFGNSVCTPRTPLCDECPINQFCCFLK